MNKSLYEKRLAEISDNLFEFNDEYKKFMSERKQLNKLKNLLSTCDTLSMSKPMSKDDFLKCTLTELYATIDELRDIIYKISEVLNE